MANKFLQGIIEWVLPKKQADAVVVKQVDKPKKDEKEKTVDEKKKEEKDKTIDLKREQYVIGTQKDEPKDYQSKPGDSKSDKASEALKGETTDLKGEKGLLNSSPATRINKKLHKDRPDQAKKPKEGFDNVPLKSDTTQALSGNKEEFSRSGPAPNVSTNKPHFHPKGPGSVRDMDRIVLKVNPLSKSTPAVDKNRYLYTNRPAQAKNPTHKFPAVALKHNPHTDRSPTVPDNKKVFNPQMKSSPFLGVGPIKEKIDSSRVIDGVVKRAESLGIDLFEKKAYIVEDNVIKDNQGTIVGYSQGATFDAEEAAKLKKNLKPYLLTWCDNQGRISEEVIFYGASPEVMETWIQNKYPDQPARKVETGKWEIIPPMDAGTALAPAQMVPGTAVNAPAGQNIAPAVNTLPASLQGEKKIAVCDPDFSRTVTLDNGWVVDYNWTGDENYNKDMDAFNEEHVKQQIIEGYVEGELNQGDEEHRGYWKWRGKKASLKTAAPIGKQAKQFMVTFEGGYIIDANNEEDAREKFDTLDASDVLGSVEVGEIYEYNAEGRQKFYGPKNKASLKTAAGNGERGNLEPVSLSLNPYERLGDNVPINDELFKDKKDAWTGTDKTLNTDDVLGMGAPKEKLVDNATQQAVAGAHLTAKRLGIKLTEKTKPATQYKGFEIEFTSKGSNPKAWYIFEEMTDDLATNKGFSSEQEAKDWLDAHITEPKK